MPSWCLTISDVDPPSAGFYRPMQRVHGSTHVSTHHMAPRPKRPSAPCFFVYAGTHARDAQYPHVTVMLESPLFQRAGMLFFRSSEFHVSSRNDTKLFYVAGGNGLFREEGGQGGLLGGADLRIMANSFIDSVRHDITRGITPDTLDEGWENLNRGEGLRPWEWEALQRMNLENDQDRLQALRRANDEAWADQFEAPEGY
jgi:hypothetical protein